MDQFGVTWTGLSLQIAILTLALLLLVRAIHLTICHGGGVEVPVWLVLELGVPFLGPVAAILYFRRVERRGLGAGAGRVSLQCRRD